MHSALVSDEGNNATPMSQVCIGRGGTTHGVKRALPAEEPMHSLDVSGGASNSAPNWGSREVCNREFEVVYEHRY